LGDSFPILFGSPILQATIEIKNIAKKLAWSENCMSSDGLDDSLIEKDSLTICLEGLMK